MKIALVHDYLKEYGGAERVLEALHEIWPEAPIYTLIYASEYLGPHQERVKNWDVHSLIPRCLPLVPRLISPLRLIAPVLFKQLDLTDYDVVIVSATGAYSPNLLRTDKKRSSHICYCHTPPRYLYGLPTAREWKKYWWIRIPAEIANHFLRLVDFQSAQKVDWFIANSKNTAQRIWKFYRKKATVIYPPVDIPKLDKTVINHQIVNKNYFLAGGRLARPKRIDLAIKACNQLKLPLKIYGKMFAGYGEELKKIAGPTIEFLGEVSDQKLAELYAGCQAFIFPAEEEDFGIVSVEAMSYGKPVIALRQGGVVESVVEGKTGVFFDPPATPARSAGGRGEPTVESLVEVLKKFKPEKYKPEDCRNQAEKFSKTRFKREIREFVEEKYA